MTQRIYTLVCLLLIVFHFQTSFAQDDLTLDDSFAAEPAATETISETPAAVPTETSELNLDSEFGAASDVQPAVIPDAKPNPMDSVVDTQATSSVDPFENLTAAQNVDQTENVNLASPIELRQREGALFGFSAGLMIGSQPLHEDYDKTNLSGGIPVATERVDKQTNSIQSVGVILRYAVTPYYKLGTDLNISYSKSQNHNSITVNNTEALGEITTLKGELNFAYAIEMGAVPVYFLAGFGAEKVSGNSIEKIINSTGLGGQIGGGFVINSTINLEAMYAYYVHRISNAMVEGYSNSTPVATVDTEQARVINQGLILRGTFSFNY